MRMQQELATSNVYVPKSSSCSNLVWWHVQMPSCLASKLVWQWPPSFYWLQADKQPCKGSAMQQSNGSTVAALTAEPTGWLYKCGAQGQSYLRTTALSRRRAPLEQKIKLHAAQTAPISVAT